MFFDNTIKRRVMQVINQRIVDAQKKYETGCEEIDAVAEQKKTELADELASSVFSR